MLQPQQLPGPKRRSVGLADAWQLPGRRSVGVLPSRWGTGRARAQRELRAKQLCRACPVITQCRTHALTVGEPTGSGGGLSESEREILLKSGLRRRTA